MLSVVYPLERQGGSAGSPLSVQQDRASFHDPQKLEVFPCQQPHRLPLELLLVYLGAGQEL